MSEHAVDARRLLCPMPVIRTQDKINTLADGDLLIVTCTDPGVVFMVTRSSTRSQKDVR
jgi:tRNA 2-thiouridine synthesizing protein A